MISANVTKVCFFEVNNENKRAIYGNRLDVKVASGGHVEHIKAAAKAGKLPGIGTKPNPGSKHPERFLDIREDIEAKGVRAYAFRLNALYEGRQRLQFVAAEPFVKLPLNSLTHEDFLTGFEFVSAEAGGWAFFLCDLDAVRDNDLADRIRAAAREKGLDDHPVYLNVPFYFNLYDPELKAAPWAVPAEEASAAAHHQQGEDAELAIDLGPLVINHGGVHPQLSTPEGETDQGGGQPSLAVVAGEEGSDEGHEKEDRAGKAPVGAGSLFYNHGGVHPQLAAALKAVEVTHGGVHPSLSVVLGSPDTHGGVHPSAASFLSVQI
jgi:hypothetical protein